MDERRYAHVAVSAALYAIDKPYLYRLDGELAERAAPGMRCIVPFGRGNKPVEGMVLDTFSGAPRKGLKAVQSLLDARSVLRPEDLKLALWLRERCFCTVYAAVRAMLPAGLRYAQREEYVLAPSVTEQAAREALRAAPVQRALLELVLRQGGTATRQQMEAVSGSAQALRALVERGVLERRTAVRQRVGDKTEQMALLRVAPEQALERLGKGAKAQRAAVKLLAEVGSASVKDVCYFTGVGAATLRTLEKKGLVSLFQREVYRGAASAAPERAPMPVLNAQQQAAYEGLLGLMEAGAPACALLYGVTGSGKTLVYIRLIHAALERNRTALVLVPEIALTPQLLARFEAQFGQNVAVLHSSLSMGRRYDEWKRVRDGQARVVVGTRSAVFAPLERLGLIVLDEEQEDSYRSEQSPCYHAREVAKYRCARSGALLLLGSATPSVESMYRARAGVYHLFTLPTRYNAQAMPRVEIVDMRQELRGGNGTTLSGLLRRELAENLKRGEQTVLFLNRRGTSRMAVCVECGQTPECPNCSVKLSYHRDNGRLMCHHCSYSQPMPRSCPSCGGSLTLVDAGVQMVQEELERSFPGVGIVRMDADSVSASNRHADLLRRFEADRVPILLGTQMVAKGLDFENVTLVGALEGDQGLYVDSYRAGERVFSLLTQVVGRAGRGSRRGRAVIQSFTPRNEVILCAARQDYEHFYEAELALRQARGLPPVRDLYLLRLSAAREERVLRAARRLAQALEEWRKSPRMADSPFQVYGPAQAPVLRVMGRYRYRITLLCTDGKPVREMLSHLLRAFQMDRENDGVSLSVERDPTE